jgi:hypothetical protein
MRPAPADLGPEKTHIDHRLHHHQPSLPHDETCSPSASASPTKISRGGRHRLQPRANRGRPLPCHQALPGDAYGGGGKRGGRQWRSHTLAV